MSEKQTKPEPLYRLSLVCPRCGEEPEGAFNGRRHCPKCGEKLKPHFEAVAEDAPERRWA